MNHLIIEALNECLREQNTELKAELASAKAVIEALRSVLSEDGVLMSWGEHSRYHNLERRRGSSRHRC